VAAPEEALRRMAEVARVPWPVVVHLRRFYAAALRLVDRAGVLPPAGPGSVEPTIFDVMLLAVTPYLVEQWTERPEEEEEVREADEIWAALETFPPERRRRLIELSPRPAGNVALARRICEASARAVTKNRIEEARELADLARFTAHHTPRRNGSNSNSSDSNSESRRKNSNSSHAN